LNRYYIFLSNWLCWQDTIDNDFDVTSAMTNRMSLFYAHATPMLTVLGDTTSRFVCEVSTSPFLYLSVYFLSMSVDCYSVTPNYDCTGNFLSISILLVT